MHCASCFADAVCGRRPGSGLMRIFCVQDFLDHIHKELETNPDFQGKL